MWYKPPQPLSIMKLLELPDALLYLILSFYVSTLADLNNLRLGNNSLNDLVMMVQSYLHADAKAVLFHGYADRYPEVREVIERPLYARDNIFKFEEYILSNELLFNYMKMYLRMVVNDGNKDEHKMLRKALKCVVDQNGFAISEEVMDQDSQAELYYYFNNLLVEKYKENLLENHFKFDEFIEDVLDTREMFQHEIMESIRNNAFIDGFFKNFLEFFFCHELIYKPFSDWSPLEYLRIYLLTNKLSLQYQPSNIISVHQILAKLQITDGNLVDFAETLNKNRIYFHCIKLLVAIIAIPIKYQWSSSIFIMLYQRVFTMEKFKGLLIDQIISTFQCFIITLIYNYFLSSIISNKLKST